MDEYEANLRAAGFSPPAPEILQARAAARDDPHAMAQFCLAWEGRIPRGKSAAEWILSRRLGRGPAEVARE